MPASSPTQLASVRRTGPDFIGSRELNENALRHDLSAAERLNIHQVSVVAKPVFVLQLAGVAPEKVHLLSGNLLPKFILQIP